MTPPQHRLKQALKLVPVVIVAMVVMIILQEAGCYDPGAYRILKLK